MPILCRSEIDKHQKCHDQKAEGYNLKDRPHPEVLLLMYHHPDHKPLPKRHFLTLTSIQRRFHTTVIFFIYWQIIDHRRRTTKNHSSVTALIITFRLLLMSRLILILTVLAQVMLH